MSGEADTTATSTVGLERRVRRLEDAHASMEKSISGLDTKVALISAEQVHLKELMDEKFKGVGVKLDGLGGKLDTLTSLVQAASTDPQGSVVNRELTADVADLKTKVETHSNLIQQGIGAGRVFKAGITVLATAGSILGVLNFLHTIGVIK